MHGNFSHETDITAHNHTAIKLASCLIGTFALVGVPVIAIERVACSVCGLRDQVIDRPSCGWRSRGLTWGVSYFVSVLLVLILCGLILLLNISYRKYKLTDKNISAVVSIRPGNL